MHNVRQAFIMGTNRYGVGRSKQQNNTKNTETETKYLSVFLQFPLKFESQLQQSNILPLGRLFIHHIVCITLKGQSSFKMILAIKDLNIDSKH